MLKVRIGGSKLFYACYESHSRFIVWELTPAVGFRLDECAEGASSSAAGK